MSSKSFHLHKYLLFVRACVCLKRISLLFLPCLSRYDSCYTLSVSPPPPRLMTADVKSFRIYFFLFKYIYIPQNFVSHGCQVLTRHISLFFFGLHFPFENRLCSNNTNTLSISQCGASCSEPAGDFFFTPQPVLEVSAEADLHTPLTHAALPAFVISPCFSSHTLVLRRAAAPVSNLHTDLLSSRGF